MRHLFLLFTVLSLGGAACAQDTEAPLAEHVVLITIDGFRPDFYLEPAWHTPNLRALLQDGLPEECPTNARKMTGNRTAPVSFTNNPAGGE